LRELNGWDPFNVTEDCDLGLRIYEKGYRTALLDSTTYEEANCKLGNWIRQRSRWVKGFIQTHLVHYRSGVNAVRKLGVWGAMGGYLAIGGGSLMMLVNPIFWGLLLLYLVLLIHGCMNDLTILEQITGPHQYHGSYQGILGLRAWPLVYPGALDHPVFSLYSKIFFVISLGLLAANFLFIGTGVAACIKRKNYDLIPAALCMPFYWMLISVAAWKGFIQIFTKPFYWEKTTHGLSKQK
jgi:cellulose synthase/poly-beta-1,6-N-acetylglucosamine synthase-like glycosyltransferase